MWEVIDVMKECWLVGTKCCRVGEEEAGRRGY
jgi:hypothetical protein